MRTIKALTLAITAMVAVGCATDRALVSVQVPGSLPVPGLPDHYTGRWRVRLRDSKQIIREAEFIDGKMHGLERTWYGNGQLRSSGCYLHGEKHGCHRFWEEDGKMLGEQYWRAGVQHGPVREWHGPINTVDGRFANNVKDGRWTLHDWDGHLIASGTYKMGVPWTGTFIVQQGMGIRVDRYGDGILIEKGTQDEVDPETESSQQGSGHVR